MRRFGEWWGRHFLHAELISWLLASTALSLWSYEVWGSPSSWATLAGIRTSLYSTLASIFGSLLGFEITGGAAAFGAIESERFTLIRESAAFPKFWRIFYAASRATAGATLISVAALIFDKESAPFPNLF